MDVVRSQREMARRKRTVEIHDGTMPQESSSSPPKVPNAPVKSRKALSILRRRRSNSEPPRRRKRLLEDHYQFDPERRIVLPGVPRYEQDFARDAHDCFNLIMLLPVIVLDIMNWNWDTILYAKRTSIAEAWTGEWFDLFFQVTAFYFVVDLIWISLVPSCVKSPATIIQHHLATILYILIPYLHSEFRWCMGACLSVELNTWFLIARRVLNKQGLSPWTISLSFLSIRVKLISIFFYTTWIGIRCILYPVLMMPFYQNWIQHSLKVGTKWNLVMLCVPLHACFCLLNLKWSYDLLMSKVRYWRRKGSVKYDSSISKGL
ncbi:hypothetical protein FisN_4Hh183 [Fistulifera solaris]|jgi:hypothetical protein|uniref:TLC domain-containing protein n=1 Tax=Fistulifera solaris TaxID=1519565 RepID=A0A1Z5K9A0_FISSO|nr:hypothetical protein FisN_4Hh183 [Fistulifera solaris]|eukprot:GAX22705.1 hypothetical protein FisN_4Hh183 [Fistulifera solaris]